MNYLRIAVVLGSILSMTPGVSGESVFRVVAQDAGEVVETGLGVLISNELIVTNKNLITQGDQVLVENPVSGARLVANVNAVSDEVELALLSVPTLSGDVLKVASEGPQTGRQVYLLVSAGTRREGVFEAEFVLEDAPFRYRFTSVFGENELGAPLMNNCGEVLGIGADMSSPARESGERQFGLSGSLPDLVGFLKQHEVDYDTAATACLSLRDQLSEAEESSKKLEQERAALEEERSSLQEQIERIKETRTQDRQQSEQELAEANARRADLEQQLREKEEDLAKKDSELVERETLRAELEERSQRHAEELQRSKAALAEQEREQRLQLYVFVGVGAGLVLLCGLLWLRSSRRRTELLAKEDALRAKDTELQSATSKLKRESATFPDVLLSTGGPLGEEIRLKVDGNALARSDSGQIIGRSSRDAAYVISELSVSRRHALLRVSENQVTIEDLRSFNGTMIDGVKLEPGRAYTVKNGAKMSLGDVELEVRIFKE